MDMSLAVQKNPRLGWKMPFSDSELRGLIKAMLEAASALPARLELSIVDDAAMAALHEQSLGCKGPTNILSFSAGEMDREVTGGLSDVADAGDEADGVFLGWLVLSADTLRRECFLYGQDAEEHCIRLLAHGIAHLLGHEHGPDMDALCGRLEAAALNSF